MAGLTYTYLEFDDLKGWADDDHQAALDVFNLTSDLLGDHWETITKVSQTAKDARAFFETHFTPVLIEDGQDMLFTGYFEPELQGARIRGGDYQYPIYRTPRDLDPATPYLTRRQIEEDQRLSGQDLELAWLVDPVDRFFLQVQGSGRILLPDGDMMRVGFSAKNGHPYTSIGQVLISLGTASAAEMTPEVIRRYINQNGPAVLWQNDSYVFFREISEVPASNGPIGAMGRSITAGRSIAVDPASIPYGAPVWIEKHDMRRLMMAQDTGSAITGAQRADIFFGTGAEAGARAGQVKDGGRMVVLMPKGWRHA